MILAPVKKHCFQTINSSAFNIKIRANQLFKKVQKINAQILDSISNKSMATEMKIIRTFLCTFFLFVATQESRRSYFTERSIKSSEAFWSVNLVKLEWFQKYTGRGNTETYRYM